MNIRIGAGSVQWTCPDCPAVGAPLPLKPGTIQTTVKTAKRQGQAHAAFAHPVQETSYAR